MPDVEQILGQGGSGDREWDIETRKFRVVTNAMCKFMQRVSQTEVAHFPTAH